MAVSMMTLIIMKQYNHTKHDATQYNDTQQYETQHNSV